MVDMLRTSRSKPQLKPFGTPNSVYKDLTYWCEMDWPIIVDIIQFLMARAPSALNGLL